MSRPRSPRPARGRCCLQAASSSAQLSPGALARSASFAVVAAFLALSARTAYMIPDDEALYALAARWLWDGILPYRDYFFAHPPGRLILAAPAVLLDGVIGIRLTTLGFFALTAAAVHRALSDAGRPGFGWLAVFLLLFTGPTLWEGPFLRGMGPVTAAVAWGLVLSARGRWLHAGLLMGAAGFVAFHVAPFMAGLGLLALLSGRKATLAYAVGPALLLATLGLLALALGDAFTDPVFAYHARKPASGATAGQLQGFATLAGGTLVLASLGGVFWAVGPRVPRGSRPRVVLAALLCAGLYGIALLLFSSIHRYYFLPLMAPLAVLGAWATASIAALTPRRWVGPAISALIVLSSLDPIHNQWSRTEFSPQSQDNLVALAHAIDQRLPPGAKLAGDAIITPWLAWITGRELADRQLDTNVKRFTAGMLDLPTYLSRIRADDLGALVTVDQHGLMQLDDFRPHLTDFEQVIVSENQHALYAVRVWLPRQNQ
ncbi:MAG: hypothetical protein ACI9WU_004709 [Myxococcota bacterium]